MDNSVPKWMEWPGRALFQMFKRLIAPQRRQPLVFLCRELWSTMQVANMRMQANKDRNGGTQTKVAKTTILRDPKGTKHTSTIPCRWMLDRGREKYQE